MTKQRECILRVIRSDHGHHTAEEILALAREELPGISRATVYNNLKVLEEQGFIRRITGDGKCDRYDSSFVPHGHLLCEVCGEIWDFTIDGFDDIIRKRTGADFSSYELKVRSICSECRKKRGTTV